MRRGGRHNVMAEDAESARGGKHGRGRGGKMHRLFEHGDLRVVLLALLNKTPATAMS